jgi:hypothetical protein
MNQKRVRRIFLTLFVQIELQSVIAVFGTITRAALKEIIIRFDIRGEVNNFASSELFCGFKDNWLAMMIGAFIVTLEANFADIFTALGGISGGNFIFGEDGCERALGHASAAVNAGIGVNIDPWPFSDGLARDHTLDRAYIDAAAVTNA